jgi:hypothetical protein
MTVNKEDILVWLTQLGKEWTGLTAVYHAFVGNHEVHEVQKFWDKLDDWHDGAYITKRHADAQFDKDYSLSLHESIEQYRLTKKAIDSLNA